MCGLNESKLSTILHYICEVQTDRARQRFRKIVDRLSRQLTSFGCKQYNLNARGPLYNIGKCNYGLNFFAFYNLQVLLTNVLSFILLLCVGHSTFYPSEALPVEKLPKGTRWTTSGSDDDTEMEETVYITPEHKVYMRLSNPEPRLDRDIHKKSATYIRRGKLFNRNGYLLRINSDGTVDGTTDKNSVFGECCR